MELKKYLKSFIWFIIPLFLIILIINILYYFDIVDNNLVKYLKIIAILIPSFLSGLIRGYNSQNKGYINGIKLSLIIIIIFFVFSLILKSFNLFDLIYYIIIILTITFGSMVGISRKTN